VPVWWVMLWKCAAISALGEIRKGAMVPMVDGSTLPMIDSIDAKQAYVEAHPTSTTKRTVPISVQKW
jgi:hypothetical protein